MLSTTFARSMRAVRPGFSAPSLFLRGTRQVSTLPENPQIFVHKDPLDPSKSLLSLLSTSPPTPQLAIGTTTALPVTPQSFTSNPAFLPIVSSVLAENAAQDPMVLQQASVFASPGGFNLGGGSARDGSGGANQQGGAGGAAKGGWIHVSDMRNPPDYGRIAWPEDIFGSVEVDGHGRVEEGSWQESGTYRVVTREGILGLTEFMRGKIVMRLKELEEQIKRNS